MAAADLDGVFVRRFRPDDQDLVRALILEGLARRWGVLDEDLNPDLVNIGATYRAGTTLTAWVGGRLVATGTLIPRGDGVAEVLRMSTAQDFRGRGLATRLLHELLAEARRRQVRTVVLETSAAWLDARSLYERNGFVFDREEDGEFGRDAFYRLDLNGGA
jgi:GNAT superfamily N-acetyltransferase